MHVADARGLTFECQPGCGFCCTATPLVLPHEAPPLGPLVVRAEDGTLRIPLSGPRCGALRADRMCGVYEVRPSVCHLYPYQVHAGRRIQVTVSLGCPGIAEQHVADEADTEGDLRHPFGVDNHAEDGARRAAELALAQPGAMEHAQRARETFAEFDRRMKDWGVHATPDKLRSAFLPHLEALARPAALPAWFAGIAEGDLMLDDRRAVEAVLDAEAEADLADLLEQAAQDAFDEPQTVLWVEPDFRWTQVDGADGQVVLHRTLGEARASREIALADLPTEWSDAAIGVLASYLRRLCHRDQTEGAAAWIVDASGYQATLPAAYARVLGEAALQVVLRAGLLAAEAGADEVDAALARRGVAAYETSYHSLPTLGAIL